MPKFNTSTHRTLGTSPVTASKERGQATYEGGQAFTRDTKSDLFLLAVANMVREDTFYEGAADRDDRFEQLLVDVTRTDPEWIGRFIPWLRAGANMRSASVVAAVIAAKTLLDAKLPGGRPIIDGACQRADEPAELLACWLERFGKPIPFPVKNGLVDACRRLYTEGSALKYDTESKAIRFADVVELCHPDPKGVKRSALFGWLLDRRGGARRKVRKKVDAVVPEILGKVLEHQQVSRAVAEGDKAVLADAALLARAGVTWEQQRSAAGKDADKGALWDAKIPSMGYMAILRNLANFDEDGITEASYRQVVAKLTDAAEVGASRQFPFRFLTAHQHTKSYRWAQPLETALGYSLANVPVLAGRTLILVDRSNSMKAPVSTKSQMTRADAGALFGTALALRAENAKLVQFGSSSEEVPTASGQSVLRAMQAFKDMGGTHTVAAVDRWFSGHDRVVIITDEQVGESYCLPHGYYYCRCVPPDPGSVLPKWTPLFTWNLAGYRYGHAEGGKPGRYVFGGLTDQAWGLIPLLEGGANATWPWTEAVR
jgi:hypothetical protein